MIDITAMMTNNELARDYARNLNQQVEVIDKLCEKVKELQTKNKHYENLVKTLAEKGVLSSTGQILPVEGHRSDCAFGKTGQHYCSCEDRHSVGDYITYVREVEFKGRILEVQSSGGFKVGDKWVEEVQYKVKPAGDIVRKSNIQTEVIHFVPHSLVNRENS